MRVTLGRLNLALRGFMELGVVCGFAWWGWHAGGGTVSRILLAVGAPVLGFGFWGAVDFRGAGSMAEGLRLIQELVLSGLAAAGFYLTGAHGLGWTLAGLSVVHHAMVYALGDRLLRERT